MCVLCVYCLALPLCILLNRRTSIGPIYIYVLGVDCMSRDGEHDEAVEESDGEDTSDSGGEDASDSGEDDGGLPVQIGLDDLGSHVITDPSSVKGLLARLALLNARWD